MGDVSTGCCVDRVDDMSAFGPSVMIVSDEIVCENWMNVVDDDDSTDDCSRSIVDTCSVGGA